MLSHGTIIRTGITCKKIPLQRPIEFGMTLKQSATRYKQKNRNICRYQTTKLLFGL